MIRIVGGAWRSRHISVPAQKGLRPTPDRVRETLFNWLGQDLHEVRCLDLFAGSGALGLEAASRGAAQVTFVDREPSFFRHITRTIDQLSSTPLPCVIDIRCEDALKFAREFAQKNAATYQLIFLDPPFRLGWLEKIAPSLSSLAAVDAFVYVEAESPVKELGSWKVIKQGHAGQVWYHLLEQTNSAQ